MRIRLLSMIAATGLALAGFAAPVRADGFAMPTHDDGTTLVMGVGAYDSGLFGGRSEAQVQFQGEVRPDWDILWGIKPWAMGFVTTGSTLYGSAGFFRDFVIADDFYITPIIGVGVWGRGNAEKDLGHVVEFRTGAEASYRFANGSRIGFQFFHLSNAGISDTNPGQESVMGIYVLPLRELKKLF